MGFNFIKKCHNLVLSKVEKSHNKIVKFEVKNIEHLRSNTRVN